jgi:hypothetical protein
MDLRNKDKEYIVILQRKHIFPKQFACFIDFPTFQKKKNLQSMSVMTGGIRLLKWKSPYHVFPEAS